MVCGKQGPPLCAEDAEGMRQGSKEKPASVSWDSGGEGGPGKGAVPLS